MGDPEQVEEQNLDSMFDLKKKKKKKKTTDSSDAKAGGDVEVAPAAASSEATTSSNVEVSTSSALTFELDPPNYSYTQLLNRVVDSINQNNPELTDKKRFTMKPPQLMRGN